jgi:hypothetical protein
MTATTKRKPGMLPKLLPMLPPDAAEHLKDLAIRQDQINQRLWMCLDNSLPSVHGLSHRGGADNLAGTQTPSTVSLGAVGTPGAAQLGFAPILHVHPLSDDLAGLGGLSGVTTSEDGAAVVDHTTRRMLEQILVTLLDLVDLERNESVRLDEAELEGPLILAPGTQHPLTAPLYFRPGPLLTTPEYGAVELEGHTFYGTQYLVRRSFDMTHGIVTSSGTVVDTVAETTIFTLDQAANYLTAGKMVVLTMVGVYGTVTAVPYVTIRLRQGGTSLLGTLTTTPKLVTDAPWEVRIHLTVRSAGSAGTVIFYGSFEANSAKTTSAATTTSAIDTTAANTFTVTAQWSAADVNNTFTVQQGLAQTKG